MRICSRGKTLSRWLEAGVHSGALLLLLLTAAGQAQDFTYTNTNGAITITGGNVSGNIVIPNTIAGLSVVSIGDNAFHTQFGLTSVVIPNTVSNIGTGAFAGCYALTNCLMPDSISTIGDFAFASCSALTSVTFSTNLTGIGNYAFIDCTELTSLTLPGSLTNVGEGAFNSCPGITNLTLATGLTNIGTIVFGGCTALTSVTIPESVNSIGFGAFADCFGLTSISIPTNLAIIGDEAFQNCTQLTSITIPNTLTNLGSAFTGCSAMTNINVGPLNPNFSSLNGILFDKSQKTLIIYPAGLPGPYTAPDTVTNIAENSFNSCSQLTSVTIPESVTSVGDYAFASCFGLTNVSISSSVITIGISAFQNCTQLTSITIPDNLANIGTAFAGCSALTNITVGPLNPNFSSLNGVLFDKAQQVLILYPEGRAGTYTVPNTVTAISKDAFSSCAQLTNVTIPNSVTNIGGSAFANCSRLGSLFFSGNAPMADVTVFAGDLTVTALYQPGTVGWEQFSSRTGIPAMLPTTVPSMRVAPLILSSTGHSNPLVVITLWATNLPFVLEVSASASNPSWVPLTTNRVSNGSFTFSDFQWTNYPSRFYRVRSP